MPQILEEHPYNGALERIQRLGLDGLLGEVRRIITNFNLLLQEEQDSNSGAVLREMLDAEFKKAGGWTKKQAGGIDWLKCLTVKGVTVCVGVEIQVSGRSDSGLFADIIHLRKAFVEGRIDLGIIIVPTDRLGNFLTDRVARVSDAKRHVSDSRSEDLPLLLIAIEHDGPGSPLPKKKTRQGKVISN